MLGGLPLGMGRLDVERVKPICDVANNLQGFLNTHFLLVLAELLQSGLLYLPGKLAFLFAFLDVFFFLVGIDVSEGVSLLGLFSEFLHSFSLHFSLLQDRLGDFSCSFSRKLQG